MFLVHYNLFREKKCHSRGEKYHHGTHQSAESYRRGMRKQNKYRFLDR